MAENKHEVMDLSAIRQETPDPTPTPVELAMARLRGRMFSQLSQSERDDLLMVVGVRLGIIAPETPGH